MKQPFAPNPLPNWRLKGFGLLRIFFGLIWAVDAWFKWQPDFIHNFENYLSGSQDGHPPLVQGWIGFWIAVGSVTPHAFAYLGAVGETAAAFGLILGVFSNLTNITGILLSVVIWATAEGFGGPYEVLSTDIGSAIIYALVFVGLFLVSAGYYYGLDRYLTPRLGRWGLLASGHWSKKQSAGAETGAEAA